MNTTYNYWITQIKNSQNKNHWRTRMFVKKMNTEISMFRLTAMNTRIKKGVARFCNQEANYWEKRLQEVLQ